LQGSSEILAQQACHRGLRHFIEWRDSDGDREKKRNAATVGDKERNPARTSPSASAISRGSPLSPNAPLSSVRKQNGEFSKATTMTASLRNRGG